MTKVELMGQRVALILQAHPHQQLLHRLARGGIGASQQAGQSPRAVRVAAQQHVLEHRKFAEQLQVLEGARHAQVGHARGRLMRHVLSREADASFTGLVVARNAVERGGLARAVGANQRMDRAREYVEGQRVDRRQAAKANREVLHLDDRLVQTLASGAVGGLTRRSLRPANRPRGLNIMKPMRMAP